MSIFAQTQDHSKPSTASSFPDLPPIGAILSGPHWPDRVRVVRVEPKGKNRMLIEAVTLDDESRLISRLLKIEDLANLEIELEADRPTLRGDPTGFRLAAEATRIRLVVPAPRPEPVEGPGVILSVKGAAPTMRRSDEVEAAAMAHAIAYERARSWEAKDVSPEARGYDLLSKSPAGQVRYIEVKGRAGVGAVELSANEWLKAEQLGADYWLYIVTDAQVAVALPGSGPGPPPAP